ncbi:Ig domain-containing protein [Nonomuraea sp. NPDC055795]
MRHLARLATAVLAAGALPLIMTEAAAAAGTGRAAPGITAGYLSIELDRAGTVTGLRDTRTGTDYLAAGKSASLVSLVVDGRQLRPTRVHRRGHDRLTFKGEGFTVEVKVVAKPGYTTLTATDVRAEGDVRTLLWGPLATSITRTIGETVGVVRDEAFAVGLRPLADRTEGAWPQEYQELGWENEVADNPSDLQVAPHEEWSAAGRTGWGSVLRAFTYDYTKERQRHNLGGYPIPVGPLAGDEGKVAGSEIALFGAAPELTPTVLANIAKGEGLPYPTQNGQWQKTAQASSQSFLVLSDLRTHNVQEAATYAKAAGIGYLYSLPNAVGPWKTTGHYQFDAGMGGDDEGAKRTVDLAKAEGVRLGVHTISDFISLDDRYVQPAPADTRLASGQRARLTRPLAAAGTTLYVDSGAPFAPGLHFKALRIGDELLTYGDARQDGDEWVVSGLKRAQAGSSAASHAAGDQAARMIMNSYAGAIGGLGVIDEIATRLATAWNTTGIMSHSYDGVESASESGWGNYGQARLINGNFRQLKAKDGYITETSRMTSNTWDALTRASWGEVGVTSMDQVFVNNAFYRANFLPGMLGWISLKGSEPLLSIESKLARGAGLNAGAGFQSSLSSLRSGGENARKVLDAINQWETARNLGAFTEEQKTRFRDKSTNWRLSVVTAGQKWSLQELDASGRTIGSPQQVTVPAPALTTTALPAATRHRLYAARLTTNTPATIRYELTGGALPAGLSLNQDTGGIIGTPRHTGKATFTVTAHSTAGLAPAKATYELTVRR